MKMYSNTISIVHSNFRRKEPLYLFIQALFLSWTDTGFRDLQFSLLFPAKNISSTSSSSSLKSNWKWRRNSKFHWSFLPLCGPLQPGAPGSGPSCALSMGRSSAGSSGEWDPEWGWPGQGAQGREPRPGLGFPPWPVTEKYLSKPPLVTVDHWEPQAAEGLRMGRIILATFSFAFTLSSISRSSMMKCLRFFCWK